jgi:hypothetical protein
MGREPQPAQPPPLDREMVRRELLAILDLLRVVD